MVLKYSWHVRKIEKKLQSCNCHILCWLIVVRRVAVVDIKCYSSLLQIHNDNNSNKTLEMKWREKTFQKALKYTDYKLILKFLIILAYSLLKSFNV